MQQQNDLLEGEELLYKRSDNSLLITNFKVQSPETILFMQHISSIDISKTQNKNYLIAAGLGVIICLAGINMMKEVLFAGIIFTILSLLLFFASRLKTLSINTASNSIRTTSITDAARVWRIIEQAVSISGKRAMVK